MGLLPHSLKTSTLGTDLFLPVLFIKGLNILGWIIIFFTTITICFLIFIFFYIYYKTRHDTRHEKWQMIAGLLIRKAVFFDDEEEDEEDVNAGKAVPVTERAAKLLKNKHFRKLLTDNIILTKKNLSGESADKIKNLYLQLQLDKYAWRNLESPYWHIQAQAIQELTLMELREILPELDRFINDRNVMVRREAQTSMVQFLGFEGLRFLNFITRPVADWQQIKLLQQLSQEPPVNISIDDWLKSANNSVVIFALKLARTYHRFELHDLILSCLDHRDAQVRLQAIYCLSQIYTDETARHLKAIFWKEEYKHQVAIIKALQNIGSKDDNTFLTELLRNENNDIKLHAARALAHSGTRGLLLLKYYLTTTGPLNEIARQILGELAI